METGKQEVRNIQTVQSKHFVRPINGETITSLVTGNTYTMGGKIGEGCFGEVYSCTDIWGNELAAKVFKPNGKSYESVKSSAVSELEKLRVLRHPNITFIYDAFEYRDTFYIITEYCYTPVSAFFKVAEFDGKKLVIPIARSLLQAVHYLHLNKYVHQDIHADNVFAAIVKDDIRPRDNVAMKFKLGDFGVTKIISEVNGTNTRAEWILPPEVYNTSEFGPIDNRIDFYHTGLLLLEIAYSRRFRFTKDEILEGKPREMALKLPDPIRTPIEKALRRHVIERTSDALSFWSDFR